MWRIDTSDSISSLPTVPSASEIRYFSENDSTTVPDWWLNTIQEELMAVAELSDSPPSKNSEYDVVRGLARSIDLALMQFATPYYILYTSVLDNATSPSDFVGNLTSGAYIVGETSFSNDKRVRLHRDGSIMLSLMVYSKDGHNGTCTYLTQMERYEGFNTYPLTTVDAVYAYLDGSLLFSISSVGKTTVPYHIPQGHHRLDFVIAKKAEYPYTLFLGACNGKTCFPSSKPIWNDYDKVWQNPKLLY